MLSLFYLFFILFMKKTTFFRFNRIMLMVGSVACMLLPLVNVSFLAGTAIDNMPHFVIPEATVLGSSAEVSKDWNWTTVLSILYFAGAAVVLAGCAISIVKTFAVCRKGEIIHGDGFAVTLSEEPTASFSFFKHIVMSREDYEQNPVILKHEMMHVECRHSFDIVLFSIITVFHWFNPLVWMARNELKEVQEYEADEAVLKQGIDATQYQLLLVKKAVGAERFQMANGFNHTKLKNRIKMMQVQKTNKLARLAYIACLPLMLSVLCFCTNQNQNQNQNEVAEEEIIPFQLLDEKPSFNGGDPNTFAKWVDQRINYPESAKEDDIQGRVVASFIIDASGNLIDPKIVSGLSEDIDNEVLRVLSSSPQWTPGKADGQAVKCSFTFPVVFTLR